MAKQDTEITVRSFFSDMAGAAGAEDVLTLFENGSVRVERIVSRGHASPPGFWYDQTAAEWVMVLRGGATLEFEDGSTVEMGAGDCLTIPSHVRHRVARTDDETVWLAVHGASAEARATTESQILSRKGAKAQR